MRLDSRNGSLPSDIQGQLYPQLSTHVTDSFARPTVYLSLTGTVIGPGYTIATSFLGLVSSAFVLEVLRHYQPSVQQLSMRDSS